MKVFLVSARRPEEEAFFRKMFEYLAGIATEKRHVLVDDPEAADIILVTDADGIRQNRQLRRFPLIWKFPNKVYYYSELATPIWLLPGVYTNTSRSIFAGRRIRGSSYVSRQTFLKNQYVGKLDDNLPKDVFFSFVGGSTSFVRKRLLRHSFNRSDVIVEDTSDYHHWNLKQPNREENQRRYVEIAMRSRFGLCPRGAGRGIIRLFEMLELGVVPVIMSDGWVPPKGPRWEDFAIFVRERDVARLPEILEKYEPRREAMQRAARKVWEDYFAADRQFNQVIDAVEDIRNEKILDERLFRLVWPFLVLRLRVYLRIRAAARAFVLWTFSTLRIPFPYALNRRTDTP